MSFQHNFSLSVQMVHLTYTHVTSAYTKMLIPWYFDNECLYVSYDEHHFISYFNNKSDKTSLFVSLSLRSLALFRVYVRDFCQFNTSTMTINLNELRNKPPYNLLLPRQNSRLHTYTFTYSGICIDVYVYISVFCRIFLGANKPVITLKDMSSSIVHHVYMYLFVCL